MKIVAINYADDKFVDKQKYNSETAYKKGNVDLVIEYGPNDLDKEFRNKYKNILSQNRGGGYWIWKPYIILKTLNKVESGDYIIYCDSGSYYVDKVKKLTDVMIERKKNIMAFELPLVEKQWTKQETFEIMGCCENKYKETNQILATYIILKKSRYTEKFFNNYMEYCTNEKILTDLKDENLQLDCFIDHRHDQSIFSLLCKKEGIEVFRDPSQYGDKPWEYIDYNRYSCLKKYKNSTYPRIVMSYRNANIISFKFKEFIKDILYKFKVIKWRI